MNTCIDPANHEQPCGRLNCIGLRDDGPPVGWNKLVGPSTDAEIGDHLNRRGYWKPGGVVDRVIAALRRRAA